MSENSSTQGQKDEVGKREFVIKDFPLRLILAFIVITLAIFTMFLVTSYARLSNHRNSPFGGKYTPPEVE